MPALTVPALLLATALSAPASGGRPTIVVRPGAEAARLALSPVEPGPGAEAAANLIQQSLALVLQVAPALRVVPPGAPAEERLEVRVTLAPEGLEATFTLSDASSGRPLAEATLREVPERARALGLRLADALVAARGGPEVTFAAPIAAVERAGARARLVVLDAGGGDAVALFEDGQLATPAWEPEGDGILFTAWRERPEIWRYDVATRSARRLIGAGALATAPAPSPDGGRVAFTAWVDGNADLWSARADGTAPVRLTADPAIDGLATWSPDGGALAFISTRSGRPQLFVTDPNGAAPRRITFLPGGEVQGAAWSPRGDRIAYSGRSAGGGFRIRVVAPDGSGDRPVSRGACDEVEPSWSPGGEVIVFTRTCAGRSRLVLLAAGDGREVELGDRPLDSAAWGPAPGRRTATATASLGRAPPSN